MLWFDESYNELHYRSTSATNAAENADCLLVVGTTLTTGLPRRIVSTAAERGIPVLNIDPEAIEPRAGMLNLPAKSGEALPALVEALRALREEPDLPPLRGLAPKAVGDTKTGPATRAAPARAGAKEPARSRRSNPVSLPGALKTPEEDSRQVFVYGPLAEGDWQQGRPALLHGASLYCEPNKTVVTDSDGKGKDAWKPAVVLEESAMAVRGFLALEGQELPGWERSVEWVDVIDEKNPSGPAVGRERAWVYHRTGKVDRQTAPRVPDGDWLSALSWLTATG